MACYSRLAILAPYWNLTLTETTPMPISRMPKPPLSFSTRSSKQRPPLTSFPTGYTATLGDKIHRLGTLRPVSLTILENLVDSMLLRLEAAAEAERHKA
jgi:hypothetical protein